MYGMYESDVRSAAPLASEPFTNVCDVDYILQSAGAQDLRVKLEAAYESGQQASSSNCLSMSTPTALASFIEKNSGDSGLSASLAASIAPADMLNVWNATKMSTKGGTVNTADGELIVCSVDRRAVCD